MIRSLIAAGLLVVLAVSSSAAVAQPATDSVWRNYDFVPGKRVLKVVNVDSQPVGRFPAGQMEFIRGNLQVVELNGKRWLESTANSSFRIALPEALGESFSVEFALQIPTLNIGMSLFTSPFSGALAAHPNDYLHVSARPGIYRKGRSLSSIYDVGLVKKPLAIKLQVDKEYAIMYVDAARAAQVPVTNFARTKTLEFQLAGNPRFPTYVSDIVVAVGLDRLYEGLTTTGEVTTRGILFDTGSDRLRPESNRTLADLHAALTRAATLNVDIEGHTDAVGEAASNQQLSERRAAAVVKYLVDQGIAAERLRAVGRGETVPAASNDTAEGRQENRRVVIRVRK
jgi:outer membrane protein OmpA-like peptidoglycan-associated protein